MGLCGGRARQELIEARVHDLRGFTHDRHRTVDDRPFGGGEGMVMKPEPLFEAVESLVGARDAAAVAPPAKTAIVLLSAAGKMFRQETARRFAGLSRVVLICGRYEGVDERVAEHLATDEISIGDFVLSGGELAAAMILDAVTRLIPGALGNEDSIVNESFSEGAAPSERARHAVPLRRADDISARIIHRSRDFGLSALHAAAFVSRVGCAGSIAGRKPRRDTEVAATVRAGEDLAEPAGVVGWGWAWGGGSAGVG